MADREKILRGAECCKYEPSQNGCPEECPYLPKGRLTCGLDPLLDDVIVLIRKQETVEPIKTPETIRAEYNCGECTALVGIRFYDGNWYFKADYCPHCGRKVAWS